MQFDGTLQRRVGAVCWGALITRRDDRYLLWVEKSHAACEITAGDWIVAEPDGSGFYPCSDVDFRRTHYVEEEQ